MCAYDLHVCIVDFVWELKKINKQLFKVDNIDFLKCWLKTEYNQMYIL